MAGYLGTYLAMAYSVVGICSYIVLRMFYGVLQVTMVVVLLLVLVVWCLKSRFLWRACPCAGGRILLPDD